MVQMNTGLDSLCRKIQQIGKLEHKVVKAVGAISHYQKQQQELADNFVRLSNKYQELKTNFHTVKKKKKSQNPSSFLLFSHLWRKALLY